MPQLHSLTHQRGGGMLERGVVVVWTCWPFPAGRAVSPALLLWETSPEEASGSSCDHEPCSGEGQALSVGIFRLSVL